MNKVLLPNLILLDYLVKNKIKQGLIIFINHSNIIPFYTNFGHATCPGVDKLFGGKKGKSVATIAVQGFLKQLYAVFPNVL